MAGLTLAGCGAAPEAEDEPRAADEPVGAAAASLGGTTCVTLKRGVLGNVLDAQLASNADKVTKNYGAGLSMIAGSVGGGQRQALLRFDLGVIPAGATIDSATLTLTARDDSHPSGQQVEAHAVNVPWIEGAVSWSSFYGSPSPYNPAIAASAPGGPGSRSFDVTGLVSAWAGGAPNHGVLLTEGGVYYANFYTSEELTPSLRPGLTVCYTEPPPLCGSGVAALDQAQLDGTGAWSTFNTKVYVGQSFTAGSTGKLAGIEVLLGRCSLDDPNMTVTLDFFNGIYGGGSGVGPLVNTTPVASVKVPASSLPPCAKGSLGANAVSATYFDLSNACLGVQAGQVYSFMLRPSDYTFSSCIIGLNQCTGSGKGCLNDGHCSPLQGTMNNAAGSNPYSGGESLFDAIELSGMSYGSTADAAFKTFIQ